MLDRADWDMRLVPAAGERSPWRHGCLAAAVGLHAAVVIMLLRGLPTEVPLASLTASMEPVTIVMEMAPAAAAASASAGDPVEQSVTEPPVVEEPRVEASPVQEPPVQEPPVQESLAPSVPPPWAEPEPTAVPQAELPIPSAPPPAVRSPVAKPSAVRPSAARPVAARSLVRPAPPRVPAAEAVAGPASPPATPLASLAVASNTAPNWRGEVMARLLRAKRYPEGARSRGEQGTAYATFTLDRNGHVLVASLVRGSGSYQLDAEAVALIRRAEPLPPLPAEMVGTTVTLTVPVAFSLR